jgi:hypothetical protein
MAGGDPSVGPVVGSGRQLSNNSQIILYYWSWIGAAREIRTPDPIITNNQVFRDAERQSVSGPDKTIDIIGAYSY